MTTTIHRTPTGISFAVVEVSPATEARPTCSAREALDELLQSEGEGLPIESCSRPWEQVLQNVSHHPLLTAAHIAYAEHRPLVLTPDAVWLTIAQGVAQHMAIHGERLRHRFVSHKDKLRLIVQIDEFMKGSSQNEWPTAFAAWADQIRTHVGDDIYSTFVCDFSTSDAIALAASHVVMMDVFDRYFQYELLAGCGIPRVTLEGTTQDWQDLREKVKQLAIFDMGWWLEQLLPICDQFVRASQGDIDLTHWQSLCKIRSDYGTSIINGWIAKLIPYVREFHNGPVRRLNPIFKTGEGISTFIAPSGLSRVTFLFHEKQSTGKWQTHPMEAIAGNTGIAQDPESLALRPTVGWAVRPLSSIEAALVRLEKDGHRVYPGNRAFLSQLQTADAFVDDSFPADLAAFYQRTDGAELFPSDTGPAFRILPLAEATEIGRHQSLVGRFFKRRNREQSPFKRLCELRDGSFIALGFGRMDYSGRKVILSHCRRGRSEVSVYDRVVAKSFSELLTRLLDSNGHPYWLDPNFKSLGTVESVLNAGK